jgi:glycosyltransferase involved in cell wall biosynthesis
MVSDPRRRIVHLGKNRGMRGAINAGVAVSRGKFFMRLDEHCSFGKGYDKILTDACKENEIMTATRYFLDPEKWEVMDIPPVNHERLDITNVSEGVRKFHGKPWKEMDHWMRKKTISETEAMQGSMWIMPRAWWDKHIKRLETENYGPLIQDSVEVTFKTWMNGGRLMLNKGTWFAHKHRSFSRTHNNGTPENPAQYDKGYAYALSQFEDYYNKNILPKRN